MNKLSFLLNLIRSAIYWFLVANCTLIFFFPTLVASILIYPFDSARKAIHPFISSWAKVILVVCPVMNVHVECEERINADDTYILAANHQSIADILVALHMNQSFKFIAKQELFLIPFLGWAMSAAGYIPLIRGNQHSGRKAILQARSLLERGVSVLFFPEGTRSLDGEIHSFKGGAFKLAAEMGIPVVPMVIDGTYRLVPKGKRIFNRNVKVKLRVLKPQPPSGKSEHDIQEMTEEVRAKMIGTLKQMREEKEMDLL